MAKILPNALDVATTVVAADVVMTQKDSESIVKQITIANFFADYYNSTQVDGLVSASAYGIKYTWADLDAQNAEVGMVTLEQGLRLDERKVYSYNGASWDAFYNLDVSGTLTNADIGVNVQAYDTDIVSDDSYVHTDNNYTTTDSSKVGLIYVSGSVNLDEALYDADIGVNVQAYDTNIVSDNSYVHTDTNYTSADATKVGFVSVTGAIDLDTAVLDADIGVNVQAYDTDIVSDNSYVHTDTNYTSADATKVEKIENLGNLVDGATVSISMGSTSQFSLTTSQNFTLSNPTSATAGQQGFIAITQDGTGSRILTLGTNYKTAGAAGITLTTTAGALDLLKYEVISSTLILVELVADIK